MRAEEILLARIFLWVIYTLKLRNKPHPYSRSTARTHSNRAPSVLARYSAHSQYHNLARHPDNLSRPPPRPDRHTRRSSPTFCKMAATFRAASSTSTP